MNRIGHIKLPTIAKYWGLRISTIKNVSIDEISSASRCFGCLLQLPLQKSHIKDRYFSNDDSLENLHLLCQTCHRDSEFLSDDNYWNWLKNRTTLDAIVSMADFEGKSLEELSILFSKMHNQWRKDIGSKIKIAIHKKRKLGLRYGTIPYGKKLLNDKKTLVDDEYELSVIDTMISLRGKNISYQKIGVILDETGIKCRSYPQKWNWSTIRSIILTISNQKLNNSI